MRKRWIVDRLKECGRLQRDLAAAWGIAEGGVSRWLNSDEQDDLPLSRAAKLADLLHISLTDLVIRLGFATAPPPVAAAAEAAAKLPVGTLVYSEGPGDTTLFAVHARIPPGTRDQLTTIISLVRMTALDTV